MMNPDLSSIHQGTPITASAASLIKPGASTVQALPMAMPVHPASGAAHPLVQALHHLMGSGGGNQHPSLPPIQGRYSAPIGGTAATAPGVGAHTVNPPGVSQPEQTHGPNSGVRPVWDGRVHYYP